MILSVNRLEAGEKRIAGLEQVDSARFLIPTELLNSTSSAIESGTSSSILPVLRTLGVENTLRLVSALLSESRILLISNSPTRLAQCARSALSILAQGLLNWQHLYIPVLPPHLFQYIAAPVPYLIGILTSLAPRLDQPPAAETLGELVIINLDQCRMETRGMNPDEVDKRIPDLLGRGAASSGAPQGYMAATDMLAQDLLDLLKVDKRALHGESGLTNVAETAVKASKAVKSGFMKLRNKGKKFLQTRSGSMENGVSADESEPSTDETEDEDAAQKMLPDYIYTQGAQNEQAEDEARIAFASFFLAMFGNMRWYLSANPGKLPELDKQRFLQQKRALGDGESSAMWPLLQNFCQTQMLEQFAKERVEEVKTQIPVTAASPLFSKCTNYHRQHSIDFNVINVRRVARQMAQNNPARTILQTSARRMAMTMTSNRTFEGDYNKAVSQLVEQCRECSSVLYDVMSVIWVRLRDSKGLHWKHGFQGLQIMRNLLYHGPVAVIAEATDGLEKIRSMKFYNDNMRSQICTQIRQAANEVYNLLVDRAKLFNIRRVCINKRRVMQKSDQGRVSSVHAFSVFMLVLVTYSASFLLQYNKETRVKVHMPFGKIHAAFNPKVRSQIAPAPHFGGEQDLIGMSAPAATVVPPTTAARSQEAPSAAGATQDIMDLFQNASVSQDQPSATSGHDPFASPSGHDPFAAPPVQTSPTQAQPRSPQQALDPQAQAHAYWAQPATGHVGAAAQPVQTAYAPNQSRMPPQAPNAQQPPQAYAGQQMAPPQHQHRAYAAPAPAQTPAHAYPQGYAQGQPQGQGYPPPQQGYPPPQQGYPPPQQGYPHAPVPQPTAHAHAQHPGGYGAAEQQQQQQAYQQYQNTQQQTAPRPPPSQFDPFG